MLEAEKSHLLLMYPAKVASVEAFQDEILGSMDEITQQMNQLQHEKRAAEDENRALVSQIEGISVEKKKQESNLRENISSLQSSPARHWRSTRIPSRCGQRWTWLFCGRTPPQCTFTSLARANKPEMWTAAGREAHAKVNEFGSGIAAHALSERRWTSVL